MTSAKMAGVRTQRPTILAAVAALEAFPPYDSAGPSGSAIFSDSQRSASDGQAGTDRRLPDGRRAAAWGCGRCVDGTSPSLPCVLGGAAADAPPLFSPSHDGRQTLLPAPPEPAVMRLEGSSRDLCGCRALLGWQPCTSRPRAERMLSKSTRGSQDEGRCAGAPGEAAESGTRHPFRDQVWLGATATPCASTANGRRHPSVGFGWLAAVRRRRDGLTRAPLTGTSRDALPERHSLKPIGTVDRALAKPESSRDPDGASLTSGAAARTQRLNCRPVEQRCSGPALFSILYAPKDEWLALVAQGWVLPFIVTTDRSGWSVLLWRPE